jgi:hypothetical protein
VKIAILVFTYTCIALIVAFGVAAIAAAWCEAHVTFAWRQRLQRSLYEQRRG